MQRGISYADSTLAFSQLSPQGDGEFDPQRLKPTDFCKQTAPPSLFPHVRLNFSAYFLFTNNNPAICPFKGPNLLGSDHEL